MKISRGKIELRNLTVDDIERTRLWRNLPHVRRNMLFKEEISPDLQKKWFESLNENDAYFIISVPEDIGVIHVKDIDWQKRSGEAGIFIGVEEHLQSSIPVQAILLLMDAFFDRFCFSGLKAKVPIDNNQNLELNKTLGYEIVRKSDTAYFLEVKRQAYQESIAFQSASLQRKVPLILDLNKKESELFLRE